MGLKKEEKPHEPNPRPKLVRDGLVPPNHPMVNTLTLDPRASHDSGDAAFWAQLWVNQGLEVPERIARYLGDGVLETLKPIVSKDKFYTDAELKILKAIADAEWEMEFGSQSKKK